MTESKPKCPRCGGDGYDPVQPALSSPDPSPEPCSECHGNGSYCDYEVCYWHDKPNSSFFRRTR